MTEQTEDIEAQQDEDRREEAPGFLRYFPLTSEEAQSHTALTVRSAYQAVIDIDRTIFRYALALEATQPVAPGKISIRFLKLTGRSMGSRTPVFIQWYRTGRDRRWLYKQLATSKVLMSLKSYTAFRPSRDEARDVIIEARKLMEVRQSLAAEIGHLRRRLGNHAAQAAAAVEGYAERVEAWLPKLEAQRDAIIKANLQGLELAAEIPEGMYVDIETMPRVSSRGRTLGRIDSHT